MAGSTDYISTISKAYNTGKPGAMNFADAFPQYDVITHVGNPNVSSSNWQRNDFPFWKYFQKNTSAEKARLREQENLQFYQSQLVKRELLGIADVKTEI